jgi:cytochrome P450
MTTMSTTPEVRVHRSILKALRLFDADRLRWLDEAAALGPLTALRFGPVRTWVITDPEAARTMLMSEGDSWRRPPSAVTPIRIGVGENLFTQADKAWTLLQPELSTSFRKKALEPRISAMHSLIEDEVAAIPLDSDFDVELVMGRIALVLAAWVLFGEHLDRTRADEIAHHQREVVGWVGRRLGRLTTTIPFTFGSEARAMKEHRQVLRTYADEVIGRAKAAPANDDVLGALLRARPGGSPLGHDDLQGHVLGLFLAGNETTAAALSWAMVQGARSPAEWQRLRTDHATAANFITETLRLTPAVWGFARSPSKRSVTIRSGDLTANVGKSQVATVYLRGMNHNPATWADPMVFRPDRHETSTKEQGRTLLPFGLGPRGCIGQHLALSEMDAVLPALARRGDVVIQEPVVEDSQFALRIRGGLVGRLVAAELSV